MKIVVTGADGLIGRHLMAALHGTHELHPLTRSQTALPATADAVVHLAQSRHYRDFPEHALDVFDVNLALTARLLDWSRVSGVRHFILASTGGVDQPGPRSYYAVTKLAAEEFARCYERQFSVLALRFHFVYGRGQRPSMLVPRLIETIRDGRDVTLAGPDGPRINPTYVGDAVAAIEQALLKKVEGTLAIAGPRVLTIRDAANIIGAQLGRPVSFTSDLSQHPQDVIGDITAMSAHLIAPRWSFADGIADMLA